MRFKSYHLLHIAVFQKAPDNIRVLAFPWKSIRCTSVVSSSRNITCCLSTKQKHIALARSFCSSIWGGGGGGSQYVHNDHRSAGRPIAPSGGSKCSISTQVTEPLSGTHGCLCALRPPLGYGPAFVMKR